MSTDKQLNTETVAIILAAGSSSRLGQSKQLLKIGKETLLQKIALTALASGLDKVVVVLGAGYEKHQPEISGLPVHIVFNPDWEKGMGSSLKCGVRFAVETFPDVDAVILMVCDQPKLIPEHLKKLIDTHRSTETAIVSSHYSGSPGVPVLFHRSLFAKLLDAGDEQGAKKIVQDHLALVSFVEFLEGEVDIDTPEDLKKFAIP